jgi:hypothetical protein
MRRFADRAKGVTTGMKRLFAAALAGRRHLTSTGIASAQEACPGEVRLFAFNFCPKGWAQDRWMAGRVIVGAPKDSPNNLDGADPERKSPKAVRGPAPVIGQSERDRPAEIGE